MNNSFNISNASKPMPVMYNDDPSMHLVYDSTTTTGNLLLTLDYELEGTGERMPFVFDYEKCVTGS